MKELTVRRTKHPKLLLLTVAIALSPWAAVAQNLSNIVSVGDGDTVRISANGKTETIRMACIDAPERAQAPWGAAATQRLRQLLPKGQAVRVREIERDSEANG
ncbi:thermonuclease family protein [Tolypothrix bouteillei VB521301_2]